jgi:tetratricopeptide (TPR) repeat protein
MADNENKPVPDPEAKSPEGAKGKFNPEESTVDLSVPAPPPTGQASGVVPLADLPDPASMSSASLISWAEVIRASREAAAQGQGEGTAPPLKVDAVSDKDLLRRIIEEEQRRGLVPPAAPAEPPTAKLPPAQIPVQGQAEAPSAPEAPSDSGIMPQEPAAGSSFKIDEVPLGRGTATSGSVVRFPMHKPPPDAAGAMPMPVEEEIPFAEEVGPEELSEAEPVLMAEHPSSPVEDETLRAASDPDMFISESSPTGGSVVNLEKELDTPAAASGQHSSILEILMNQGVEPNPSQVERAPSDVVDLGGAAPPAWPRRPATPQHVILPTPEHVDLPEGLDEPEEILPAGAASGVKGDEAVDLYSEGPVRGGITESGTLEVDESKMDAAERRDQLLESSHIDLGSHPSLGGMDLDAPPSATAHPSGQDSGNIDLSTPAEGLPAYEGLTADDGTVDMALPESEGGSSMIHRGGLTEQEIILANQMKQRPPARPGAPSREEYPGRAPAQRVGQPATVRAATAPARAQPAAPAAPSSARERRNRMLTGGGIGLGVGILATVVGMWLAGAFSKDDASKPIAKSGSEGAGAANEQYIARIRDLEKQLQIATTPAPKSKTNPKTTEDVKRANERADRAVAERDALNETLAKLTADLKGAGIDEPKADAALAKLLQARADADAKLKEMTTAHAAAEAKVKDLTNTLTAADTKMKELTTARAEAETRAKELMAARAERDATLKALAERLQAAKFFEGDPNRDGLLQGLERAIARASAPGVVELLPPAVGAAAGAAPGAAVAVTLSTQVTKYRGAAEQAIADLRTIKDRFQAQLAEVRTPAQSLDLWLPALADRANKAEAAAALQDVERVQKATDASPEAQAKALAVKALALRNRGDFTGAREAFAQAQEHPGFARDKPWGKFVASAAEVMRNPAAFAGITQPSASANPKNVIETIDSALKLFPPDAYAKDHARLLAQRSLAKLEADDLDGAAADAAAAVKNGAGVDGQLAQARVAEKQGNLNAAETAYREVMKSAPADSPARRQAQLGLARVLLRGSTKSAPKTTPAAAVPGAKEVSSTQPSQPALLSAMLVTFHFAAPDDPEANVDEALRLADMLIAQKEYLGHIIKADALTKKGLYTEALSEYSTGVKRLKVLPPEYDGVLDRILTNHPALQRPSPTAGAVNPDLASQLFSDGAKLFFERRYDRAEELFAKSVSNNAQDARYLYFLGLARWQQGKREVAAEDFKAAAALERQGHPASRVVSDSLERIQGDPRRTLNQYRP